MYTLYKFHFLNGITEINQLFDDILIIWPAPVYIYKKKDNPCNKSCPKFSINQLSKENFVKPFHGVFNN